MITVKRDIERDKDSDKNSENILKIDSKLGSKPNSNVGSNAIGNGYERRNSLSLLDAVRQLGNLEEVVLLVDGQSDQRERINNVLGQELASHITFFSNPPIMKSLADQFVSKPVVIFSDSQPIRDFT